MLKAKKEITSSKALTMVLKIFFSESKYFLFFPRNFQDSSKITASHGRQQQSSCALTPKIKSDNSNHVKLADSDPRSKPISLELKLFLQIHEGD